ncbi:hypothetical protein OIU74_021381 [Salix koriyanagi]|uniref:Uncharacterized protein n=1 Tax=Salix koriyanagi TaxID=2511006 RepID=A0A9Q0WID7_9ROSI|nr:hypothetical protein OIU74_021381 [Salix koriyanagi]
MFDIPTDGSKSRKSGPITGPPSRTGSFGGAASHSGSVMSNAALRAGYTTSGPLSSGGLPGSASLKKSSSGPLNKHGEPIKKSSGPQSGGVTRQNSGSVPSVLPATGLITSGPVSPGPLNSSGAPQKGIMLFGIHVGEEDIYIMEFTARYPDTDLRAAKNGQYVKVSGVVTCGNVPLESSFLRVPRCVYTSTRLYEYRAWGSKPANPGHLHFKWGLRSSERHVVDFYISDFQSGLRALVKTGSGTGITPFVDDSLVVDINPEKKDLSPEFVRWLGKKNLSSDERLMRLKEGCIKEGSTVSVMGIVQRNDNVLMIIAPPEPMAIGWQWSSCIFPAGLDGIVLRCEDTSKDTCVVSSIQNQNLIDFQMEKQTIDQLPKMMILIGGFGSSSSILLLVIPSAAHFLRATSDRCAEATGFWP